MTLERRQTRRFYSGLALAISATAFLGFYFTYFAPMTTGNYPPVSPAIHVHGWSFFLWYVLFPLQAILVAAGRTRLHMRLGIASVLLAAVMTFTGILVASVRIDEAFTSPGDLNDFWGTFGLIITSTLVLFIGFYVAAFLNRGRPELHKRFMIMASASALGAAVFRVIVAMQGYNWLETPMWVVPAAILLPNLFIVAGMVYDFITCRSVHSVYVIGLAIAVVLEAVSLGLATNPAGDSVRRFIALFSDVFGFLY